MEKPALQENSPGSVPTEQPSLSDGNLSQRLRNLLSPLFQQKKYLYIVASLLVLSIALFVPIKGRSLFDRLTGRARVENLAPNSGFEKGSGNKPEGWTTRDSQIRVP